MEAPRSLERTLSRWDGSIKNYTKDCGGCKYYREINGRDICGWGVAFKYLAITKNPRKCEVRNREQDFIPSAKYLDKIVANVKLPPQLSL